MSQFLGTHQNRLDAKGRVSIPAQFRAVLRAGYGGETATSLVLRPSHKHPCIEAWPANAFAALATPLDRLDVFSDEHDDFATALYATPIRWRPTRRAVSCCPQPWPSMPI